MFVIRVEHTSVITRHRVLNDNWVTALKNNSIYSIGLTKDGKVARRTFLTVFFFSLSVSLELVCIVFTNAGHFLFFFNVFVVIPKF